MLSISVVVPCRNGERFLAETLASIRAQTRTPLEVLVVDDASSDQSGAIAKAGGATVLRVDTKVGLSAARNLGAECAKGDVIALCDADDIWLPNHLADVCALLDRFPEAGLGFSRVRLFGDLEEDQHQKLPANAPVDAFWTCLEWSNVIIPSAALIRRTAWQIVGGFDARLCCAEDYDLWARLARATKFVSTAEPSVRYRKYATQLSKQVRQCRTNEYKSRRWFLDQVRKTESAEFVARVENVFRAAWSTRLEEAWNKRDDDLFAFYLTLRSYVPDAARIAQRWRRKRMLLPVARVLDRARSWLRHPHPVQGIDRT